ncbi:TfoX/Sxy family protein [Desulfosporosinus sp. SYSU MS00001]|uniref:TfoX/Sxy family protein n=1 Tax=Desulfosporosinus sp. SYSU MS00001 TaxID=3416284 RepID=UPI003CF3A0B5
MDESNKSDYIMAGMKPFKPFDDKPMRMPYYEVPVDILENREQLAEWAIKALFASRNNPTKPKKRKLGKGK